VRASVDELLKERSGIRLDIGGGGNPQPGFVNMDARPMPGVDIVHDVTRFPWPLPDESVTVAIASHLVEHIPPDAGDVRVASLVKLLLRKGVIDDEEVREFIGELEPGPRFIRFMNEVWRVLKPDGEFAVACPHGYSPGHLQDPTHINQISEATWAYFDPLEPNTQGVLYRIYSPMPWKIKYLSWSPAANLEVVLVKRREDRSYGGNGHA
jgi:hypothetical protein